VIRQQFVGIFAKLAASPWLAVPAPLPLSDQREPGSDAPKRSVDNRA
jgi:hypothetical protein